jgi:(S)-sulfolactate dehydrogenase
VAEIAMKIILTEATDPDALKILEEAGDVNQMHNFSQHELLANLRDADAVIVRAKAKLHGDLLRQCALLRCVAKAGVGLDNIDVTAATQLGIKVISASGLNANAVAEHTMALALAAWRRIVTNDRAVRNGQWWEVREPQLIEAAGSTLGIVGFGNIGRRVAEIGLALRMQVLACDICPISAPANQFGRETQLVSFEEVLGNADLLSLHVPLTEATHHLVDAQALAMIKPTAILVNTSRGGVIDQAALVAALRSHRLRAACLDVFEHEPLPADDPLLGLHNVILSPHTAALTQQTFRSVALFIAKEVVATLQENRAPRAR